MVPLVVIFRAPSYFLDSYSTSTGGHHLGRASLREARVLHIHKTDADLVGKSLILGFFLSARQCSQDGAEHAATVATALYGGTDPGRHGYSKSGGILGRGKARGGAGQRTRWRVFQNPRRSRCTAIKYKEIFFIFW